MKGVAEGFDSDLLDDDMQGFDSPHDVDHKILKRDCFESGREKKK